MTVTLTPVAHSFIGLADGAAGYSLQANARRLAAPIPHRRCGAGN
jgi:hypothetical protein